MALRKLCMDTGGNRPLAGRSWIEISAGRKIAIISLHDEQTSFRKMNRYTGGHAIQIAPAANLPRVQSISRSCFLPDGYLHRR